MDRARPVAPSLPAAVALHLSIHLRRSLHWRAVVPALAVVILVALAGAALSRSSPGRWDLLPTYFSTVLLRAIALVALGFGTAAIRADAEQGALAAFLLRPRAPVALALGRLLAVALVVTSFALLAAGMLFGLAALIALPPDLGRMPWQLAAAAGAGLCYGAIFVFFGAVFRHATALSLAYLVLIDMGLGAVSQRVGLLSPYQALSVLADVAPDASLSLGAGVALWGALAQLGVLTVLAAGATVWRLQGDNPD